MFERIEEGKRRGCCGTNDMKERRLEMLHSLMGMLLNVSGGGWSARRGVSGEYRPRRREPMVLFPDPEGPTRAVQDPAVSVKEIPERDLSRPG